MAVAAGSREPAPLAPVHCTPQALPSASASNCPSLHHHERGSPMKNRKREICTSGSVRMTTATSSYLLGRRTISASGRGRCRAAGRLAHRMGASLSDAAGAHHRRHLPPGGAHRHHRAPDRSMAVGAARPAIRHREPAGRRQQYRHRGGRACAAGRLHAAPGQLRRTRSTRRSTTSSISISSATSRRSRASSRVPSVMVVNPSVPAKTVPEFIAYAKANPGKINMASAGIGVPTHVAGELFKMMTGVNMRARAVSRRGPRA